MKSLYKRMGGTYRQEGDYFVPNIALPDTGTYHLGKYGRIRRRYLKDHRPALYSTTLLNGTLSQHLAEIETRPATSAWSASAPLWQRRRA